MNVVQLHERVRFWVDIVSSTRFESEDIDNALNVASDNKVRESYDKGRFMNKSDAFQKVQRIRDELGPIVKKLTEGSGLAISSDLITIDSDISYRYMLSIRAKFGLSGWHPCFPLTYNRKNVVERNPYRRVRTTPVSKVYYNEDTNGINISHNIPTALDDAEIYYLADPAIINYGIEYSSSKTFTDGDVVYAVEETVYGGVTYKIGDAITISAPTLSITSGLVVFDYVDCDIRASTHEEISRRGAYSCLITAGEIDKANQLMQEIMAS